MTLKTFLNDSNEVLKIVSNQKDLIEYLSKIASFNNTYISLYKDLRNSVNTRDPNATHQRANQIVSRINNQDNLTLSEIQKMRPYDFFIKIQTLITSLQQIDIFGQALDDFLAHDIKDLINLHTDAISDKNFDNIFSFVSFCNPFITKLKRFKYTADIFIKNLQLGQDDLPENNEIIEIQIYNQITNLENFSIFLRFIDKLYQDLCKAAEIQYIDFPLNIIKVESGSIWAKIFGKSELIKLIRDLLFGLGEFCRDLVTGKIDRERFENKIRKADLIGDLILKSKELGIGEDKKVLLEKAFGDAISDFSKSIPSSTTEIQIDNSSVFKLDSSEIKALEEKKTLMINKKNDIVQN